MLNQKKLLKKFENYVYQYNMKDENIKRKYFHSIRVMEFAHQIAVSENLSNNDTELSIIAGLLHDYARFEQWTKFHTYNDLDSIDHGDLAVYKLFENNEIENFYTNKENYSDIYDSIKYHNKYCLPKKLNIRNKKICEIIRDADKLDILNILIDNKNMMIESNDEITPSIEKNFLEGKMIDYKEIKNPNDKIILSLSMLYDINYPFSIKYIIDNKIIQKLYENIENKKIFQKYFDTIIKYLKNRI